MASSVNNLRLSLRSEQLRYVLLYLPLLSLIVFLSIKAEKFSYALGLTVGLSPLYYRRVLSFNTYLFLLVLSLILEKYSYYIGFTIRLPMVFIIGTLLVLFISSTVKGGHKLKYSHCYLLFVLLFLLCSLGAIWAINPVRVIRVSVVYLFLFCLFLMTHHLINTEKRIKKALEYFVTVGLIGSLYGIYQIIAFSFNLSGELPFIEYFSHSNYYNTGLTVLKLGDQLFPRINSTFNDPVLIGSFAAMSLMILIGRFCSYYFDRKLTKRLVFLYNSGGLILFITIILTFSRSAWFGLFLGFLVLSLLLFNNKVTRKLIVRINLAGLLLIIVIAIFYPTVVDNFISRITQAFDFSEQSTSEHLKWLKISLQAWAQYPLLGVGLNNFGEYYAANYQSTSHAMTHSAYFSFLAETGSIGFILEVLIILMIIRYLYMGLNRAKMLEDKSWYFIFVGLFSAYFVILGSNITYHFYTQFYVWFFMGLIVATSDYVLKRMPKKQSSSKAIIG